MLVFIIFLSPNDARLSTFQNSPFDTQQLRIYQVQAINLRVPYNGRRNERVKRSKQTRREQQTYVPLLNNEFFARPLNDFNAFHRQ